MKPRQYCYYSTQRPIGPGTFPKPSDNPPIAIRNFDEHIAVEQGAFLAWGTLTYNNPLTTEQIEDYELRPSPHNPDIRRKMDEQAQVVGDWEKRNHIPDTKRLTWWYSDFGSYVPGDFVTPKQLAERYQFAIEHPKLLAQAVKRIKPFQEKSR